VGRRRGARTPWRGRTGARHRRNLLRDPAGCDRDGWQFPDTPLPGFDWVEGDKIPLVVTAHENTTTGFALHRIEGVVRFDGASYCSQWDSFFGMGVMLFANIPICWFFGYQAMRA
jgi:hypothetical protein